VPCARWHRRHSVAAAVSVPTASELSHCCLCLHALPIRIPRQTARQEGSFKRKQGGDLGDRSTPSRPCSPRQSLGSEHPVFATSKCRVSRYWFRSTAGKAHACSHAPHMPAALQIYLSRPKKEAAQAKEIRLLSGSRTHPRQSSKP
jgi:hypothetical protein